MLLVVVVAVPSCLSYISLHTHARTHTEDAWSLAREVIADVAAASHNSKNTLHNTASSAFAFPAIPDDAGAATEGEARGPSCSPPNWNRGAGCGSPAPGCSPPARTPGGRGPGLWGGGPRGRRRRRHRLPPPPCCCCWCCRWRPGGPRAGGGRGSARWCARRRWRCSCCVGWGLLVVVGGERGRERERGYMGVRTQTCTPEHTHVNTQSTRPINARTPRRIGGSRGAQIPAERSRRGRSPT